MRYYYLLLFVIIINATKYIYMKIVVRKICDANGFSMEFLFESGTVEITTLEMFLANFPKVPCFFGKYTFFHVFLV